MASTSTGYARSVISKEQPSSSGQVETFSSGCILNVDAGAVSRNRGQIELKSGAELELESGSTLNVETGGSVQIKGGAKITIETSGYLREPVSSGTTNATSQSLPAFGISFITAATSAVYNTSGKGGPLWKLNQPKGAGYVKTFVIPDSTYTIFVRFSTDKSVAAFGHSTCFSLSIKGGAAASTLRNWAELVSRSSVEWAVTRKGSGTIVSFTSAYRK